MLEGEGQNVALSQFFLTRKRLFAPRVRVRIWVQIQLRVRIRVALRTAGTNSHFLVETT